MNMKAMYKFSYGLFVLTTAHEGKRQRVHYQYSDPGGI